MTLIFGPTIDLWGSSGKRVELETVELSEHSGNLDITYAMGAEKFAIRVSPDEAKALRKSIGDALGINKLPLLENFPKCSTCVHLEADGEGGYCAITEACEDWNAFGCLNHSALQVTP